ncbi:hypothetical protein HED55_16625 [Ochrobactrum haematophilum]|uniref:Uncharacterized protein n=1 Tax=Brucella haematophila TaxID=419474 RepID=A0ABX1DTZ5_9HYPH|nr:hypothetical protein [Brucella haematophila]
MKCSRERRDHLALFNSAINDGFCRLARSVVGQDGNLRLKLGDGLTQLDLLGIVARLAGLQRGDDLFARGINVDASCFYDLGKRCRMQGFLRNGGEDRSRVGVFWKAKRLPQFFFHVRFSG